MKLKNTFQSLIAAGILMSFSQAQAATITLDLTTNNVGSISLGAGANDFSYTGFNVEYLIVAGGGGGGGGAGNTSVGRGGGGGGAGGLLSGNATISGVQTITVGAGGTSGDKKEGTNGGDSSALGIDSTVAIGGGGGGSPGFGQNRGGADGGSGGGARGNQNNSFGSGTPGQGNNGGNKNSTNGGGGGGAGAAGSGVTGGSGSASLITGSSVTYATGGNGGVKTVTSDGADAAANTGNGGGGGSALTNEGSEGGDGGSGIVVVSYAGTEQLLTGGNVSTAGGNTIHQFTTTGASTMGFNATIAGDIDGAGDFIWDGGGTLTLDGNNSYTGTTSVSLGDLSLSGTISSTSNLSFGTGTLFLDGSGVVNVLQSNYSISDAQTDIDNGFILGSNLQVSTFNDGSNVFTQISVIPEPSAALLGVLGLLALLRRRRA